jgi:hypothetical protein
MSRRASLPGADELFRATGSGASPDPEPRAEAVPAAAPAVARLAVTDDAPLAPVEPLPDRERHSVARRRSRTAERRPTGRERHDEKITVYCSAEELIDLERARLTLRGDFGIAVDRGRIVREAIALVLEDLEARGADSTLVRRLDGR